MPRLPGDADAPNVTVPPEHFDQLYADKTDPWTFEESWYEQRKYALTVVSLPRQRYRACLELGCSIGLMTKLLAQQCDHVTGIDSAIRALDQARLTLGDLDHVTLTHAVLPDGLPDKRFDLIVASEVLYYFTSDDLTKLLDELIDRLEPDGHLVAAHWRASDKSYGYDGYNVHHELRQRPGLQPCVHHDDENFVLDVLRRAR